MPNLEHSHPSKELTDEQVDSAFNDIVAHFDDDPASVPTSEIIPRRNVLDDILAEDEDESTSDPSDERPLLSEMERYESSISKGLDWAAEKIDGGRDRFTGMTSRLDDLAYRVDTEGKKELVPGFLRTLGRIALRRLYTGAAHNPTKVQQ